MSASAQKASWRPERAGSCASRRTLLSTVFTRCAGGALLAALLSVGGFSGDPGGSGLWAGSAAAADVSRAPKTAERPRTSPRRVVADAEAGAAEADVGAAEADIAGGEAVPAAAIDAGDFASLASFDLIDAERGAPEAEDEADKKTDNALRAAGAAQAAVALATGILSDGEADEDDAAADPQAAGAGGRRLVDTLKEDGGLPLKPRSGDAGYMLVDLKTHKVLERRHADHGYIPASVTKVPTALYALDALGADYRYETGLYADGEIREGVLKGDLYLVGSGDPTLDTGDLADLAKELKKLGLTRVAGSFYFDASALPASPNIEPTQPVHASYNPSISGLNLNFNRVLMKWERLKKGQYNLEMLAHARRWSVAAPTVLGGLLADDDKGPVYRYERAKKALAPGEPEHEFESWSVKKRILGRSGRRWFPIQRPGVYAAKTFQAVAAELEIEIPEPKVAVLPGGTRVIASHRSETLKEILRGMLRFSTNLTAEAVGMTASRQRGLDTLGFDSSGDLMSDWTNARFGLAKLGDASRAFFGNHSGLASDSRLTPRAAVEILANAGPDDAGVDAFRQLMPRFRDRSIHKRATVRAKTGTIYYGRGLIGYIDCKNGGRYAFAYLHSDIPERARFDAKLDPTSTTKPAGASSWLSRARGIERKLLGRWTKERCG